MGSFEIEVDRLGEAPTAFTFSVTEAWWLGRLPESESPPTQVEEPFSFALEASASGEDLTLELEFSGRIGSECSRCGKRYSHALRDASRLRLKPAATRSSDSADPEAIESLRAYGLSLGEDLDSGWYRGPILRLDELLCEVIALAMPLQPLCREDCPGVCAHCGAERENGRDESGEESVVAGCDCEDEKIESPFAVLAQLKGE